MTWYVVYNGSCSCIARAFGILKVHNMNSKLLHIDAVSADGRVRRLLRMFVAPSGGYLLSSAK